MNEIENRRSFIRKMATIGVGVSGLTIYDHKLWRNLESGAKNAGHGGMDFVMMYDFVEAIRNKRPAPLDCYDAAVWSAISALSEMSVARGGALVDFPDFTRGNWIIREPAFAL